MRRVCGVLILLVLLLLTLTGCWNRRELNDLALVLAMSIDKAEEGRYLVTVQVVDPGEVASKQQTSDRLPVTTYSETGKHVFEAVRKMTTVTPRKLYFSHLQMLVLSEEVAKEGINKPLEFLQRDPEFRKDFYVAVSRKVQAKETLESLTTLEKIPANKIRSSLETSQKAWAPTVAVSLDEVINDLTSEGKNLALTGLSLVGDAEKSGSQENVSRIDPFARLKYGGIAVFKKDKLIGWLNEKESKGYNYITDKVNSTVGKVPCPDEGDLVVEVIRSKARMKGKIEDGRPLIDLDLFIEVNVGEVSCKMDLTKPESMKQIEESTENTNIDIVEAAIKKAKQLRVDIFGFGEAIHRSDPQAWKTMKNEWNEKFVQSEIRVHSDVKVRRTGTVNKSFMHKEEE